MQASDIRYNPSSHSPTLAPIPECFIVGLDQCWALASRQLWAPVSDLMVIGPLGKLPWLKSIEEPSYLGDLPVTRALDPQLVSIITPALNAERFIEATIHSVLAQTYPHWEMHIMVDRSSRDRTEEIAARFVELDSRIRLHQVPERCGVAYSRNFGFQQARGRYIALLDADDLWLPEKLEKQVAHHKSTGAALSYTAYRRISEDGKETGRLIEIPKRVRYEDILKHNAMACLTVMVDQAQTGPIHMGDEMQEDFCLWLRLLRQGYRALGVNEDLALYRIVPGSRSSKKALMASSRWRVYRDNEKLPFIHSAYYFGCYAVYSLAKRLRF